MKSAWLAVLLTAGCSAQVTTGYATRSPDAAPRVIEAAAQVEDMRNNGPTIGARVIMTVNDAERPIAVRHGMVDVGYQYRPEFPCPGIEGALDLGIGEPTFFDFDGLGGYVGTRLSLLYRIAGHGDHDYSAYYTVTPILDVVLSGYTGIWTAPAAAADRPVVADAGGLLGLRFGIGTDVARSPVTEEAKR